MAAPKSAFALGLAPAKAVEWLKAKQVTTENYRNLTASETAKVYTIARMTDLDMLNDIKQSMVRAAETGQSFHDWRKDILQHLQNKGWLHPNGHNGHDIIDPGTGEVFGAPRRLETIFRTNMQAAYSAGQYQSYMANLDNRPYWMYDAVGDARTRPAHAAMDGLVYRYSDPFWTTFYPPNGYNCRCSVIALSEQDMAREGLALSVSGPHNLVETNKVYNKKGDSYPTIAYKAPDGSLYTTDRGFAYNAGRMNYRPDLDKYDRALAHEFAKAEMGGAEFQAVFKQLEEEFYQVKGRLKIEGKPDSSKKIQIRNTLQRQLKFAAGVLSLETQNLTGIKRATVWLSDDTLVKQVDSREGQNFGVVQYALLPEIINTPDYVFTDGKHGKNSFLLVSRQNGDDYLAVLKYLESQDEIFLDSFRRTEEKEIERWLKKQPVLKRK
ncbi:phage minor head protein [Bergeriella denitrificans]|uniref:Putative phage head morphogenesis protein n=1 Tax=Bergeriella denitrificans TaxID=494 RepID=A0A378UG15_BERDE|nr:phage minor head protein [Bergeriella denitrificans]STZ76328.1 putative phage head morphogenesis protein [Bergeriella denitrificans]